MDDAAPAANRNAPAPLIPPYFASILKMAAMYLAITYFTKGGNRHSPAPTIPKVPVGDGVTTSKPSEFQSLFMGVNPDSDIPVFATHDEAGRKLGVQRAVFHTGHQFDMYVYIAPHERLDLTQNANEYLAWKVDDIVYNDNVPEIVHDMNITVTHELAHNATSLYAHVYFITASHSIDDATQDMIYQRFPLTRLKKKIIPKITKKLLEASNDTIVEENTTVTTDPVPHWVSTLALSLVVGLPPHFPRNQIPSVISQHMQFQVNGNYYPVLYHNDFWVMSKNLQEINSTLEGTTLPLKLSYSPISFWKWNMQVSLEQQWKTQQRIGASSDKESDMIREVLMDTNPWLLAVTGIVSFLHMIFDFLAFKNDIQFWRKKKSMAGMSVQSIGVNCFFQTIIFLYLMDNDTSWMILMSSGIGLCIEYWKFLKAFQVSFKRDASAAIGYSIDWQLAQSYAEDDTRTHDSVATTHLLYVVVPLVVGYSAYSLIHRAHKSFYSWALGSLVGFVYAFGFILMTPQVASFLIHHKYAAVVYQLQVEVCGSYAVEGNAIVVIGLDLFAFVIKMPLMHRLACFRDDIIFFIYLYQRWVYRVDMTRTNEFGQGGDGAVEEVIEDTKEEKPAEKIE